MTLETIYDHPRYYDLLFGFDRSHEADFYHHTFSRCGVAPSEPVLEVACGPARVALLLARRGWRVTGLDRSEAMLALAREHVAAEGLAIELLCGDMTAFAVPQPFAAAYNPISSFRLLHTDAGVDAHLRCMAAALRPGGVYVIDLGFVKSEAEPVTTTTEAWEMSTGDVTVRAENEGVTVVDAGIRKDLAWGFGAHLRGYTTGAFAERIAARSEFAIESWHPNASGSAAAEGFSLAGMPAAAIVRRAMVVLRRR